MNDKTAHKYRDHRDRFAIQMAQNPISFGVNLKRFREEKLDLTQVEAAGRIGVDPRVLQRWEAGGAYPRRANRVAIAEAYDIDLADLMHDEPDAGRPPQTIGERLDEIVDRQIAIEEKLDAVLGLFTDAEQLAAAIDRRREGDGSKPTEDRPRLPGVRPPAKRSAQKRSA